MQEQGLIFLFVSVYEWVNYLLCVVHKFFALALGSNYLKVLQALYELAERENDLFWTGEQEFS